MKKNLKRGALLAASAATVLSLTIATPSFAHDGKAKGPRAGSSSSAEHTHSADSKSLEKHAMGEGKKKGKGMKGDRKHEGRKHMSKTPAAPSAPAAPTV